jgi:L-cysteine:1D-myo-inositol 2-amino-2-deoxy-alpha-D-glucopyranoside ligase
VRLYDTARRAVVSFEPGAAPGSDVKIYTCGITPYDAAHLGHAATYLTYDIIQRRLIDLGYHCTLVRNVTDVDDDILRKAKQLGVHYLDLAAEEMARFSADMSALGLLPAASEPRATSAIPDILGFIGMVLESGHAYRAGGAVYFDVSSWPGFGSISHYDRDQMVQLAEERGGNPEDPHKSDPLDFVLWQPSAPGEPAWDSLWGPGRPGWHIECSALAVRELGETIDLHGGGSDLIFPHHECESAQSEAATGVPFVRHWAHTGMVCYEGTKMSKSLGNLVFVRDLLDKHPSGAVRLALLEHHYRSEWSWDAQSMELGAQRWERWRSGVRGAVSDEAVSAALRSSDLVEEVRAALDDDLATHRALAAVDVAAGTGRLSAEIAAAAGLLGVDLSG